MNTEQKIFNFALGLVLISVLLAMLTSCSAAVPIPTTPTVSATSATGVTATHSNLESSTPPPYPICTVTAGSVYLRSGSGMSFEVKKVLHRGDLLQVLARGEWLKVQTAQRVIGWVYGRYCQ